MKKILIVDDDSNFTDAVKDLLSKDFSPVSCNDSQEALKLIETEEFHLLITDFSMPNMNGVELATRTMQLPQYQFLPIFLITGMEDDLALSVIKSIPRIEFFEKPVSLLMLLEKVKKVLNS